MVDDFLNNNTMYRLVLYFLTTILGLATILSFFNFLPFSALALVISVILILSVCWVTNFIFSKIFKVIVGSESVYITAFILSLIVTPTTDFNKFPQIILVCILAISSKFILAINKKHIFNPAAIGVVLSSFIFGGVASWWVGTIYLAPVVLIGGLLIVKKIDRFDLSVSFLGIYTAIIFINAFLNGNDLIAISKQIFLDSPILFFSFIMLTEPITSSPKRIFRIMFGGLVALLFTSQLNFANFYMTPELALVVGNIFSFIVSPKERLILKLKEKIKLTENIYDFVFSLDKKIAYVPGQYMEWTIDSKKTDLRGNRRYFTLASSPTEDNLRIGVRLNTPSSSFKSALVNLNVGQEISASSLSGEFTLPKDATKKLVFIAGGIGITPFRSIIKYLMDRKERRIITLFYSVKTEPDAVYFELFNQATQVIGLKSIINASDKTGFITGEIIKKEIPDYKESFFYLSGPHGMVDGFKKVLKDLGVSESQIKIDYFPGYV